jgi:polysaccharide deacetylase family protein (PEP-CTERM system associated)
MIRSREIIHALSFDIEDWFHLIEVDATSDLSVWDSFPTIVVERTRQILDLLSEFDVQATFFILGWVADRHPELVPMIAERGHEIGSHSYWHRKVYELTPRAFRDDLQRSLDTLHRHPGVRVRGFRAPSFSITPGTEWAFDVMRELGLEYDASLFPANRAHGGYPCALVPHTRVSPNCGTIVELPMSVWVAGPVRVCFSGGGYFRLLPAWFIERCFRRAQNMGRPSVVYLHPRDLATDCPKVPMPLYRRFKCYVGQGTTARKLRYLLSRFRFDSCCRVLQQHQLLPQEAALEAE